MKNIKYILVAFACCLFTGCMDEDWDTPDTTDAFGNKNIVETNVLTIKSQKDKYTSGINASSNSYEEITDDIQIKGRVVGNDIQGNIYNEIALDDGTSSILICISQGGLFAYLPVGQEIIVDLKGLYIGGYGKQAEIGTPYTNARGSSYVSRMSRIVWNQHFRLLGTADPSLVSPEIFDASKVKDATYLIENSGKLMTLQNVQFKNGDGITTYAPEELKDAANCVSREITGFSSSNLVVRTSTYADFAAKPLPTGKCNITGIFTRYNNIWQILIREESDVEEL